MRDMKPETRKHFNAMYCSIEEHYGISDIQKQYAIKEGHAVTLNDRVQNSSDFLSKINMTSVDDMIGTAMHLGVYDMIASRTDTNTDDREPQDASEFESLTYQCHQTNWDVCLPYKKIDALARHKDFRQRYSNFVTRQIALDRIRVGFHGQSAAKTTDKKSCPNGEDINLGWLKLLSQYCPANYLTQWAETDQIKLGLGGDYKNVDALVYDVYSMIAERHTTGNEVVIIGRELISYDTTRVINAYAGDPQKKQDIVFLNQTYAGLQSIVVPSFPARGVFVTDLANLSLYWLATGMRRQTHDNAKRDRIEEYISSDDAYMIESPQSCAAIHAAHVVIENDAGPESTPTPVLSGNADGGED